MTNAQALAACVAAHPYLTGCAKSQNAKRIDLYETLAFYDELVDRFGADEIARCDSLANAEWEQTK